MTLSIKTALILGATFGVIGAAQAADVPTLDVNRACTPLPGDRSIQINTDQCFRSEREARDQLTREWENFPAVDRGQCTQTATMGGTASYVELITCLEMKRDVAKLPADRGLNIRPAGLPTR